MWPGETCTSGLFHLFSLVSLENKSLFSIIFLLKAKAVILESSVAGMGWAGTVSESEENGGKKSVVFVSSVFLKCFMLATLFEVTIVKSKLSPLTLAVQVHRGTSGNGVMPVSLLYMFVLRGWQRALGYKGLGCARNARARFLLPEIIAACSPSL